MSNTIQFYYAIRSMYKCDSYFVFCQQRYIALISNKGMRKKSLCKTFNMHPTFVFMMT